MSRAQTVIAFHGTVKENVQRIIDNGFEAKPVQLDYKRPREMTKWLGRGAYFYIGNPALAWDWAVLGTTSRPSWCGKTPCVIVARLAIGLCLDLQDPRWQREIRRAYDMVTKTEDPPRQTGD